MSLSMSKAEREAFLAETHVGILSVAEEGRGPLAIPVWYRYAPGEDLYFVTGGRSKKARLIRTAGRASLCVQTEAAPYQYVTVEGRTAIVGEPDFELDVRQIALRYLGRETGELYLAMTESERAAAQEVLVRMITELWGSADFRKMTR